MYNERNPMIVRLSQKGWVVIPAALREKYGLLPGTEVQVVDYGGVLAIVPAFQDPTTEGHGLLKETGSLAQYIVEEHRREREQE
jgi:AbrB family looped-hinge helix DNA binding protein